MQSITLLCTNTFLQTGVLLFLWKLSTSHCKYMSLQVRSQLRSAMALYFILFGVRLIKYLYNGKST